MLAGPPADSAGKAQPRRVADTAALIDQNCKMTEEVEFSSFFSVALALKHDLSAGGKLQPHEDNRPERLGAHPVVRAGTCD